VALGALLFRREAVDYQRGQRQWGEAVLPQPLSAKILTWALSATVAAAVLFLSLVHFSRTESVRGYLNPSAGIVRVYPIRAGTITSVYVRQDQLVRQGQLLFAVATPESGTNGQDVNEAKLTVLNGEARSIRQEMAAEGALVQSQTDQLQGAIASAAAEVGSLEQQMQIQKRRVAVTRSLLGDIDWLLARGDMSLVQAKEREAELLDQEQVLASLAGALAEKKDRLEGLRYTLAELPLKMAGEIELLRERLADTEQGIATVRGQLAYALRAPIAGRVAALQAVIGESVDPQHMALEIVPRNAPLQAIIFIPTRAAGFAQAGQRVRLRYDAFPYENFGTHEGRIIRISRAVLTNSDVTAPLLPGEPSYEAVVSLDRPAVDADGKEVALKPGMLLQASIVLDRVSLLRWLFAPLLGRKM
jgi:membrane fusion protein